jgi:hypothetical protein
MRPPPERPARWGLRGALALLLLLIVASLVAAVHAVRDSFDHTCEVCVTHRGRTVCREAVGSTAEKARSIAVKRACAFLAAERDEREACLQRPPVSVHCRER